MAKALKEAKIRIHSSMDSLYDVIPRDELPDEFGGKSGKLDDLQGKSSHLVLFLSRFS